MPAFLKGLEGELGLSCGFRHQYLNPNSSELGFFFVCTRQFPRVVAGSCGILWTSPSQTEGRFRPTFPPYRPFLSERAQAEKVPKSTSALSLDK